MHVVLAFDIKLVSHIPESICLPLELSLLNKLECCFGAPVQLSETVVSHTWIKEGTWGRGCRQSQAARCTVSRDCSRYSLSNHLLQARQLNANVTGQVNEAKGL
jgi:hypothetical protein